MRHAPLSHHVGPLACGLAAVLAGACTTASSHPPTAGTGGGQTVTEPTGGHSGGGGSGAGGSGTGSGGHVTADGGDALGGGGSGVGGGSGGGCNSLPLCDTFEATAANAAPSAALWTLIPTAASGSATIDTIGAHGSAHSLKVVSPDRLYLRNSAVIGTLGPVVHVRFYARFSTALPGGHGAMVVTHPVAVDQYTQQPELRFGSQDMVFHWNTDTDAANIPDVNPTYDATSFAPAANTWYCIELTINTNGHLNVSVDGSAISGLTEDGVATPGIDQAWTASAQSLTRYAAFADFNVGWQSYGAGAMTVWFDDVALSASPIGCQN